MQEQHFLVGKTIFKDIKIHIIWGTILEKADIGINWWDLNQTLRSPSLIKLYWC